MTTITLLAGARTIGGTQIIVEDQGARLLFDCGVPYNPSTDPFVHVHRRSGRELSDLMTAGLAPYIPGVYRPDAIEALPPGFGSAIPPSDGPAAVALSHSHLDHSHLAGFVDARIPIYTTGPTARIVDLLGRAGIALGGAPRSLMVPEGDRFSVGPMHVRFVAVDHDVCGACGMLIQTTTGPIAYSGDLRLHGSHPERTLGFARTVRDAGARVLILEGTRLGAAPSLDPEPAPLPPPRFEAEVPSAVVRSLNAIPGKLGVILLTAENGERVEAIAAAASEAGRTLVMEPQALAFTTAALGRPIAPPHAIYHPSTPYEAKPSERPAAESIGATVDSRPRTLSAADISSQPGRYLLQLSFQRFADLLDIVGPGGGGVILACNGPPLGRFDPSWASLEWWAATLACQIVDAGSTGHAAASDLALIAGHAGAPTIMSIHSHQPELLAVAPERLLLPEPGRAYDLASLP